MSKNSGNMVHGRIAFYGGAFDPVHNAHIRVAQYALDTMGLSKLVFVPSAQSPLKAKATEVPAALRVEMLRLALGHLPNCEIELSEIEAGGLSYTIHTARRMCQQYPEADLFWIIGGDQYAQIDRWHAIDELAELMEFIVLKRPEFELPATCPVSGMRVHILETPLMEESSTAIRARVVSGKSISAWVPEAVAAFIDRRGLYKS